METPRYLHQHPLKVSLLLRREEGGEDEAPDRDITCDRCDDPLSGRVYACDDCGFYLHEACANLPQRIQHFFHPCLLFLKLVPGADASEHQEGEMVMTVIYRCEACNFELDDARALHQPEIFRASNIALACPSGHVFEQINDQEDNAEDLRCSRCEEGLSGKRYCCHTCGHYFHEYCAFLPYKIQHFFHGCPLFFTRIRGMYSSCAACFQESSNTDWYYCEKCSFGMHVECTKFSPIAPDEQGILHYTHHHALKLICEEEEEEGADKDCTGCKKPISGNSSYACLPCGYYLHSSCAGLPREIRHFFHSCPLFLKFVTPVQCDACFNKCDNVLVYICEECDFIMHVECAQFQSDDQGDRIQDLSHHHPVKLSEASTEMNCNLCNKGITCQDTYGACELCQFQIHKFCMGLPSTLKSFFFRPIFSGDGRKRVSDMSHQKHYLYLFEAEESNFIGGCNLCGREIRSHDAHAACEKCEFEVHESCLGSPLEVQLPCHPCHLSLGPHQQFYCNICNAHKNAIPYQCEKCMFYMDVECARSLQEIDEGDTGESILHFCHHHPLQLFKDPKPDKTDELLGRKLECLVCVGTASGLTYGCKWCGFYLHKSCLNVLSLRIFIGDCPFVLRGGESSCRRCGNYISQWGFFPETFFARPWCIPCALREALSFWVSPSSMLTKLDFHPCCLALAHSATFTCNACFTHCHTHAYYCDHCDFYVGVKCAMILRKSFHGEKERIQHFCHFHPLQRTKGVGDIASCKICGTFCLEPCYFCDSCDFHVHKSCLDELPQKIDHHFLYCTLILLTTSFYRCVACERENNSGLTFRSIERGIKLCMECALRPKNIQNEDGTFTSIHHWHKLALVEGLGKDEARCLLCKGKCSLLTYCCGECEVYFHKACAELPLEMHHPLHRRHPLTLKSSLELPESSRCCSLCRGDFLLSNDPRHSGVYHYKCKEYSFQLDKKCVASFPSIHYQAHSHLLTFVEHMKGEGVCHVCYASCKNNSVFRCAECNFTLHLTCGPLPCEIKHPSHVHSLILEDFYVEENYTDAFPCHVCEERRDPRLPVYLCAQGCPMICEIKCVLSEVMPKLLGAHGEVELRTTFPNVASKVIIEDGDLIDVKNVSKDGDSSSSHSISALDIILGEMKKSPIIDGIIRKWKSEMLRSRGIKFEGEDGNKILFRFSKEAFKDFSSKLDCTRLTLEGPGIPKFISKHDGPAVEGEEYMLPQTLILIYQELFGKGSTISATFDQCLESKSFKSVFVFMICVVLHDMRVTKLVDVTNERVLQWLTLLKLVEHARFDIGFIFDQIKLVWETHFLIQSKALVDDTSKHLKGDVDQLSQREKELELELERTRKMKREAEEKLDDHYEYEKIGLKSFKKELKDVLLIKWKPASSTVIENLPRQLNASN